MSNIDDRIAAALRAAANQVSDADLAPAQPPTSATIAPHRQRRHVRWVAPMIAAAAVAGIAITLTAVAGHHPSASNTIPPVTATTTTPPSITGSPTPSASHPAAAGSLACFFGDASPCRVPVGYLWYVPLWPFANYTQAQREATIGCPDNAECGLTAAQTALKFTQTYLGFTDITRVTSTSVTGDQARIGVGYLNPNGQPVTAAVLHLIRYEEYANTATAPWEVVGSEDTTLSLEKPAYGSHVGYSFTVGGHIAGVDENIHVWVWALNDPSPVAEECCVAAGGDRQPWSQGVGIPNLLVLGPQQVTPVTIVASTGGHVQEHERFAIQGAWLVTTGS